MSAWRAGESTTATSPEKVARAYTSNGVITPDRVSTASISDALQSSVCVVVTRRSGSSRSIRAPEKSPKNVNGRNWQSASRPTATAECVRSRISQVAANRSTQVPIDEIV